MPIHEGSDNKGKYIQWGGSGKKYYYTDKKSKAAAYKKAGAQESAARHSGFTGNIGGNQMKLRPFVDSPTLKFNISKDVRHDQMEGRDYLVAPMIMLVEGVHNGSDGPGLYPAEEIKKIPEVWNHKPVVVYHPEQNGRMVSACDPIVLSTRKVGVIMNTRYEDGKLKAEAWLEQSRIKAVDERVGNAIENNEMMELSTGLFADKDNTEGVWNEEEYSWIARNFKPDHLALLPDMVGACSLADGAGFLRLNKENKLEKVKVDKKDMLALIANEMSHESTRSLLGSALRAKNENAWVENVFDAFFIYEENGTYFAQNYSTKDGAVKIEGLPEQVVRVTEYRTISGTVIGNTVINTKGQIMDKDKIVDALIANEKLDWSEEDRDDLMGLSEKVLEGLTANAQEEEPEKEEKKETPAANTPTDKPEDKKVEKKEDEKESPAANQEETVEQYVGKAPKKIREALTNSLRVLEQEKTKLIDTITANELNEFTKEQLEEKEIGELTALAKLAAPVIKEDPNNAVRPNYFGQAPVAAGSKEEPLLLPTMNFEKNKKTA
jgi:Uncharacterized protein conserved in bacteria (DUF2213)